MRARIIVPIVIVVLLVAGGVLLKSRVRSGDDVEAFAARMIPRIEEATGLSFLEPPRMESRTRDEVREFLVRQLEDSLAAHDLAAQELVFKRLGMIDSAVDLRSVYLDVLEEQIAGYYDPRTKVLYIVEGASREMRNVTVTHELIHALQDQHISLDSIQKMRGVDDRQLAAHAVIEGQATLEQMYITLGSELSAVVPGGWEGVRRVIREEQSKMPRFAAAPNVVQELLLFPYLSGAEFVRRFKQNRPGENALHNLPSSTEQILHTDALFPEADHPTSIVLPPLTSHAPVYENTMGEFGIRLFLYEKLKNPQEAMRGAMGWDGDRYVLFRVGNTTGIAWVTVWDSAVDAEEYRDLVGRHFHRSYATSSRREVPEGRRPGFLYGEEFRAAGRTVFLGGMEIDGRPTTVLVDVPDGTSWQVLDFRRLRLTESP